MKKLLLLLVLFAACEKDIVEEITCPPGLYWSEVNQSCIINSESSSLTAKSGSTDYQPEFFINIRNNGIDKPYTEGEEVRVFPTKDIQVCIRNGKKHAGDVPEQELLFSIQVDGVSQDWVFPHGEYQTDSSTACLNGLYFHSSYEGQKHEVTITIVNKKDKSQLKVVRIPVISSRFKHNTNGNG